MIDHSNNQEEVSTSLDQLQLDVTKEGEDLDQFLSDGSSSSIAVEAPIMTETAMPKKKKKEKEKREKKKKKSKSSTPIVNNTLSASDSEDEERVEILEDEDYHDF